MCFKLNSSVCNNKQIWNSNTCRCDCNEDFAGTINYAKGYTWNPSTRKCQCDTWCKPGQYLDHKNCACKNKLIGRVIEECTSIINETMMNNNDNNNDNNFYRIMEAQIAGLTNNTVDNLADITKLKAIDTNYFVTRTKFSADTNALDDKIDGVEKKYLI